MAYVPLRTGIATSSGRMNTAAGIALSTSAIPTHLSQVQEGRYTFTVYSLIRNRKYTEVIRLLTIERHARPTSRAALSLLAYCYYQTHDYANAASCYEALSQHHADVHEYKLNWIRALYKAGQFSEALALAQAHDRPEDAPLMNKLMAAIYFQSNDLMACRALVDQSSVEDAEVGMNKGCLLFKEGKVDDALKKFQDVLKMSGYRNELAYNMALCFYVQRNYVATLKMISDIIEHGIKKHPELNIGMRLKDDAEKTPNIDAESLQETYLIEAFNLRAAVEFQLKNLAAAREALADMPPRPESELDSVTLHNQALMNMDVEAASGFEKLHFLLEANPCPPETLGNLLLMYLKHEYYSFAADLLAQFPQAAFELLDPADRAFIDAVLLKQGSAEESYKKLEEMALLIVENLRQLTKKVQNGRQAHDDEAVKDAIKEYDDCIERYVPLVMAQAKIYWDMEKFTVVEKILRKSMEFCGENDVWKLNMAHVLFMQEKFTEAIQFYEPVVQGALEHILDVPAIVLANLCVSYIMTSQNEVAEDIMRRIEAAEEVKTAQSAKEPSLHLCIINLVIGTLYCSKGNYEFGISRIIKSLEPMNKNLSTDTWHYAKRCFVALYEILAKQMLLLKDSSLKEILDFLDAVQLHGKNVIASLEASVTSASVPSATPAPSNWGATNVKTSSSADYQKFTNNAAYEARRLKSHFLAL